MTDKEKRAHDLALLAVFINELKKEKNNLSSGEFIEDYEDFYNHIINDITDF